MQYYTYTPIDIDGILNHPTGYLDYTDTCGIYFNGLYHGSIVASMETISMFNPIEIAQAEYNEAVAAQPTSGSI